MSDSPVLANNDFLMPRWKAFNKSIRLPTLHTKTQQFHDVNGVIHSFVHIGVFCLCTWFDIAKNLAVTEQPGMLFLDGFVCKIFTVKKQVMPWNLRLLEIRMTKKVNYSDFATKFVIGNSKNLSMIQQVTNTTYFQFGIELK